MPTVEPAALAASPLLYNLTPRELEAIAAAFTVLEAPADTVVIREGQVGDSLFIVARGHLDVTTFGPTGDNVVGKLVPGDFFGEISLIDKTPRSATVKTRDDATLYVLTHAALHQFARNHRDGFTWFMVNVARGLAHKLREANQRLAELATR